MKNSSLKEILEEAKKEVDSWPEWKKKLGKEMMEELAKPYEQFRRYSVTKDGTII